MTDMKGWKVALLGVTALGVAGVSQGKVVVLDAFPNTGDSAAPGIFDAVVRQTYNRPGNYVQSAYLERQYGILPEPAVTNANYEPAAARSGTKSFRELSGNNTRDELNSGGASDSFESTVSGDGAATGMTDVCVSLLTICGLAAYQLRRKQQSLKHLPLSH
jgi:hypothetical protein